MDKFLQPEEFNLDDIFKGKYEIPVYQRPYSWGQQQVKQLLTDISSAFEAYCKGEGTNADDSVLFTGTIFIKTEANVRNEYTIYTVVDGQQRITTLTLLLMTILNRLYLSGSEDDVVGEIRNYLWKKEDRKNDKEKRVLTLGNIDKQVLADLFDELYSKNNIVEYAKERVENTDNQIENNLLENFLFINDQIEKISDSETFYNYIDFIKYNIKVISIKINTNMVKLFSIFESINSKGKPLEDIDLIKSYIFQNLKESDYEEYLRKWGELIEKTNDRLNDYFTIYIRANVSYYKTSIKLDNFKSLSENSLKRYYDKDALDEVLKSFINDMLKKVKYYNRLSDFNELEASGVSQKSVAFFRMNRLAKYNHTEPLYFKLLSLRDNGLDDEIFDFLVEYAFRFILTFQTISSRESKNTIKVFSDVQNEIYKSTEISDSNSIIDERTIDNIKHIFNKMIYDNAISNETLRNSIRNTMTYRKNRDVVKILLTYLLETNDQFKVDYLKVNAILKLGKDIHVDHILPQSPKEHDPNFKYYVLGDFMMLKPGQDFTPDPTVEKLPLEDFYNGYLHKFGNLRLEWASDNIRKSNHLIKLEEFDSLFNCYKCASQRETELVEKLIDSNLLISTDNYDFTPGSIKSKRTMIANAENYLDVEYQNFHPISFSLFGDESNLNNYTYQQLHLDIFDTLFSLEKERLSELAHNKLFVTTGKSPYMSSEREELREPYALGNDVYIEKNISPVYMFKFYYRVLDEMGLEPEDLLVTLEER